MARQIAATIDGFTPLFDVLAGGEGGLMRAAVFGKVWRYCQMKNGACTASQDTLADELGVSRETINRHLKALVADGYLEDTTPVKSKHPHRYIDTGKITLIASVSPVVAESHNDVTQSHYSSDAKSHKDTETNKETRGAANAAPIIATIPATADVANSTDMNTPKVDAVTDFFNRATKAKTHRDTITAWRGAEHLKDVCIALCDATGLPVQKGDGGKWLKGAVALYELGASADILRRVWNEATERDRQFMTHPAAFVERVRGALAAMPAQPTAPTRRIIDWQEQPDGSMKPIYEAVQS